MSTVVVGLGSWGYATLDTRYQAKPEMDRLRAELSIELHFRLLHAMRLVQLERDDPNAASTATRLNSAYILPQFRAYTLRGLAYRYSALAPVSEDLRDGLIGEVELQMVRLERLSNDPTWRARPSAERFRDLNSAVGRIQLRLDFITSDRSTTSDS
jgi:hypothetical protein